MKLQVYITTSGKVCGFKQILEILLVLKWSLYEVLSETVILDLPLYLSLDNNYDEAQSQPVGLRWTRHGILPICLPY